MPDLTDTRPFVSVVITTYQHERFIGEAVRSALAQTYANREVIVVDDGSTDGTWDVLGTFETTIRAIRQPNAGVAGSRNTGIRHAQGSLIAFLDGDDSWHPTKLERQVDAYLRFPASGAVITDFYNLEGTTRSAATILDDAVPELAASATGEASLSVWDRLLTENFIATTGQVMVTKSALDDVGVSDTRFPVASDYDLYLRIACKYPFTFVRERLVDWRYVPTSASGAADNRRFRWWHDVIAVLETHAREAPHPFRDAALVALHTKIRETARFAYYYASRDPHIARQYLRRLLLQTRGNPTVAAYLAGACAPRWLQAAIGGHARRWTESR